MCGSSSLGSFAHQLSPVRPAYGDHMKLLSLAAAAISFALSGPVVAQDFPNKPITLVIGLPAGGVADIFGRHLGTKMGALLGTTFVIDNKPGAGGAIGANFVAGAKPDGYTILYGTDTALVTHPIVAKSPLFFPDKAFAPIYGLTTTPWMFAVRPDAPYKNLREVIEFARKNPGKLNYFTIGPGSSHHIMGELFQKAAGVTLTPIPYKGGPPGFQDFFGGRLELMMDYANTWAPYVAAGKAIPIGVAAPTRVAAAPNVPTFAEQGVNVVFGPISALVAPAATPKAVIDKLATTVAQVHKDPEFIKFYSERGSLPLLYGPAETKTFLEQRFASMKRLFDELGIKPE